MRRTLLLITATILINLPSMLLAQTLKPFASFSAEKQEFPESITRDRQGNLYLGLTFAQTVKKVTPDGRQSDFAHIPDDFLLGITIDPFGNVVVAAASGIWKVSPAGHVWLFADVPGHISLNDLTYDHRGNLYVSDDSLFVIWKIDSQGHARVWSKDPHYVVTDQTFPIPTGCNGLAFTKDMRTLYVTNTSDGFLLAVEVRPSGEAGPVRVIASGPQMVGVDGIRTDEDDNVYIANNIARKILRVSKRGRVTTLVEGGLLSFPTSLVFGRDDDTLFICNNGNAFISDTPSGQGVLKLTLPR